MADARWNELKQQLRAALGEHLGHIEYGNLRLETYDPEGTDGDHARIAMAYELPGGSTNQLAVSYEDGSFQTLDSTAEDVLVMHEPREVVDHLAELVAGIPAYRGLKLRDHIDEMIERGSSRQAVLEELSRLLRLGTEFRGGSLTVNELTDACHYVAQRFETVEA